MWTSNHFALALLAVLATLSFSPLTHAADLNGAWASDASVCNKVFVKSNNRISCAPDAELYGGGFLVEGDRATGTFQKCRIESSRTDGNILHILAACSSGVMVSDTEVTVKVVDDNNIALTLDGPDPIKHALVRCSM